MNFGGTWRRQLLRAGTIAALVPIAIMASFGIVVAGAGGLGGLGSLGQIVTGPEVSPVANDSVATPAPDRDLALVAPPTIAAAAGAPLQAPRTQPAPEPVAPAPNGQVGPRLPEGEQRPPVVAPAPVAPPPPPPPPPPVAAATPPQPAAPLGDGVGDTVGNVVDAVGELIGGLGKTLGGILDGPPPRR